MNALACALGTSSVLDIATTPPAIFVGANGRTDGRVEQRRETTGRLMIPSGIPRKRHPDIRVSPVRKIKPADAQASHQVGLASPRERSRTCNSGIASSRTCLYFPRLIANQRNSVVFENSPLPSRAFRIIVIGMIIRKFIRSLELSFLLFSFFVLFMKRSLS